MIDESTLDPRLNWKNLVGHYDPVVTKLTAAAEQTIVSHADVFKAGLKRDNLPQGFFIIEKIINANKIEKILCYDPRYVNPKTSTPLRPVLVDPMGREIKTGDVSQFPGVSKSDFTQFGIANYIRKKGRETDDASTYDVFCEILKASHKESRGIEIVERIQNNPIQKDILEKLTSDDCKRGNASRGIVLNKGAIGIEKFLKHLEVLRKRNAELFEVFFTNFIQKSKNLLDLTTPEAYYAMSQLATLSQDQIVWWNAFVSQQINTPHSTQPGIKAFRRKIASRASLPHMVEAFQYFLKTIQDMGSPEKPLTLPSICSVTDAKHMHVSLDILLAIIQAAVDPAEQMNHLDEISLDREAAYFAVDREKFRFVSKEMELTPDKSNESKRLTYRIDKQNILNFTENTKTLAEFKKYFFRYVGGQQYTHAYYYYLKLWDKIKDSTYDEENKIKWATAIALSATGKRIFSTNLDNFNLPENVKEDNLNFLLTKLAEEKTELTLNELEGLGQHDHLSPIFEWLIKNLSSVNSGDVLSVIAQSGFRKDLNFDDFANFILAATPLSDLFKLRLIEVFSRLNFDCNEQSFLDAIKEIQSQKGEAFVIHYLSYFSMLIDVKQTKEFPDATNLVQLMKECEVLDPSIVKFQLNNLMTIKSLVLYEKCTLPNNENDRNTTCKTSMIEALTQHKDGISSNFPVVHKLFSAILTERVYAIVGSEFNYISLPFIEVLNGFIGQKKYFEEKIHTIDSLLSALSWHDVNKIVAWLPLISQLINNGWGNEPGIVSILKNHDDKSITAFYTAFNDARLNPDLRLWLLNCQSDFSTETTSLVLQPHFLTNEKLTTLRDLYHQLLESFGDDDKENLFLIAINMEIGDKEDLEELCSS